MLLISSPDLRLSWTAYDPLDMASGSIDVLGFQAPYIALANKLLPGFTTITTSPRYVSMLCAAVGAAEAAYPGSGDSNVRIRQARMTMVKSYERAWALACGLASGEEGIRGKAVDGLRGIQSVRRRLIELSGREKAIRTSSFNLLANQVRYGGIGAYSTLMEDCHLATMRSVSQRPLGTELADSFPRPDVGLAVWDEDRPLSLEGLKDWGTKCHLGGFTQEEGRCLTRALRGGEERGWEDDVRWTTLRMLAEIDEAGMEEPELLDRVLNAIRDKSLDRLKLTTMCMHQVEATITLIQAYERLYQTVQFLFDGVRAAATDEPEAKLASLAASTACISALQALRAAAGDFEKLIERAATIHPRTAEESRVAFVEAGVVGFAKIACGISDGVALLELVLDRHRDVQHGKFDRGERKAAWVLRDPTNGSARLTAQRHQLPKSGRSNTWDQVHWHPYRTFGAQRFVKACRIR